MSLPNSTGADASAASEATLLGADDSTTARVAEEEWLPRGSAIDRYVVLGRLGAGSMGVVYSAFDPDLDRKVAIKLLRAERRGGDDRGRKRLLREAQSLAKLSHPNVTSVHDIGTHQGEVFLAMEYVEGDTLDGWIAKHRPDWRGVLHAMRQAGEGLRAAHAAGLVHRDFKPGNVLVTAAGEVSVTDFGLARPLGEIVARTDDDLERSRHESLQLDLTRTGALLGTPGYMSPEQIAGTAADARSDQFSFCVTTWEALYGKRPFPGKTLGELAFSVTSGLIDEPPADTRVPARIRKALRKGLAGDANARHRDMDEVLAALAPRSARPRIVAAVSGVALAAGLVAIWAVQTDERCTGADAWIADVWGADRLAAIEQSVRATGTIHADLFLEKIGGHLGAYAAALTTQHAEACRASVILQEESTALFERRIACLNERRAALGELARLLSSADLGSLSRLTAAGATLPVVDRCSADDLLDAGPAPPDPAIADAVESARAVLAMARVQSDAAEFDDARANVDRVITEAEGIDYAPLSAEAFALAAALSIRAGKYPEGERELEQSFEIALRCGHERIAALAGAQLVNVVGTKRRDADAGARWGRHALALAQHHAAGGLEEASVRTQLASLAQINGDLERAEREIRAALEIREARLESDHPDVGNAMNTLGIVLASAGRFDEARDALERALAVRESAFGTHHPDVAGTLVNLGTVLLELDRNDDAREMLDRALAIDEDLLGAKHPDLVPLFATRARINDKSDRLADARADLERALAIREYVHGPEHAGIVTLLVNLAQLTRRMGDPVAARAHAVRAESIARKGANAVEHGHTYHALAAFAADDEDFARAAELYGRAVDSFDGALGKAHADTAAPLVGLGEMRLRLGDARGAVAPLERAVALTKVDAPFAGQTRFALARALWENAGERRRARALASEAITTLRGQEREQAEAWLADH